jgi:hypothetical protein
MRRGHFLQELVDNYSMQCLGWLLSPEKSFFLFLEEENQVTKMTNTKCIIIGIMK